MDHPWEHHLSFVKVCSVHIIIICWLHLCINQTKQWSNPWTKKRIEGWQLVWKRPRWNLPVKRDKRRKVKCRMLFGLIAFDIHPRSVCFSTKVTLCKAAHCAGLGAEKQRESVCQRVLWGHIGFTLIVMNVQLILGLQRDCGERVEDC